MNFAMVCGVRKFIEWLAVKKVWRYIYTSGHDTSAGQTKEHVTSLSSHYRTSKLILLITKASVPYKTLIFCGYTKLISSYISLHCSTRLSTSKSTDAIHQAAATTSACTYKTILIHKLVQAQLQHLLCVICSNWQIISGVYMPAVYAATAASHMHPKPTETVL